MNRFRPLHMLSVAVWRSLGSSQHHCARDFQAGMFAWAGAAAPVQIMMLPTTLGGAAYCPRNSARHLAFWRLRVCRTSAKRMSCRAETMALPRRIRKAHRAPSTRGAFPSASATHFLFFSLFGYCGRGPPRRSDRPLIPAVARRIT